MKRVACHRFRGSHSIKHISSQYVNRSVSTELLNVPNLLLSFSLWISLLYGDSSCLSHLFRRISDIKGPVHEFPPLINMTDLERL